MTPYPTSRFKVCCDDCGYMYVFNSLSVLAARNSTGFPDSFQYCSYMLESKKKFNG